MVEMWMCLHMPIVLLLGCNDDEVMKEIDVLDELSGLESYRMGEISAI